MALRIDCRALRQAREAKGWTQDDLAARARTYQGTISALERGVGQRVDLPLLDRIARALGVDPLTLFTTRPLRSGAPRRRSA